MDKLPENLQEILQAAQRVQEEMGRVQDELATRRIEGSAGGGMVTAVVNGRQQVVSIKVDPTVIDPSGKEMLQDLIVAAINQALNKAAGQAQEEMAKLTGGFGLRLPGLSG